MTRRNRKLDIAFLVLWTAILLAIPAFKASSSILGWPDFNKRAIVENRILAQFPNFKATPLRKWGRAFDDWYDDNFAWRADILRLHKAFRFQVAMCPIMGQVPGYGGMVFRRGGTWPEIDDYLGAITLDDAMRSDWRMLIEGRVAWAEAYGAHYLEVVAPVKAQVHPEFAPWTIRNKSGASSRRQLEEAMRGSYSETNVLFFTDRFREEAMRGREMFYKEDHHVSAYGCWMLYCGILGRLRDLWFPGITETPYFDNPPESVRMKKTPGCYTNPDTRLLEVSAPGYAPCDAPELGITMSAKIFPMCPIRVRREGDGLRMAMRHDSLLRFPLSSWRHNGAPDVAIPLGDSFSDVAMFIFKRFTTEELEKIVGINVPDVIIEEFPECKIAQGVFGLDETMRRAAEFGRAKPCDAAAGADAPRRALALAVFEKPQGADKDAVMRAAIIDSEGREVAAEPVAAGARRAVFFGPVEGTPPFTVALRGGKAENQGLELRLAP